MEKTLSLDRSPFQAPPLALFAVKLQAVGQQSELSPHLSHRKHRDSQYTLAQHLPSAAVPHQAPRSPCPLWEEPAF